MSSKLFAFNVAQEMTAGTNNTAMTYDADEQVWVGNGDVTAIIEEGQCTFTIGFALPTYCYNRGPDFCQESEETTIIVSAGLVCDVPSGA